MLVLCAKTASALFVAASRFSSDEGVCYPTGKLQYVSFVTKKDVVDWFRQNGPNADGAISTAQAHTFFELLSEVLRLRDWRQPLDELLAVLTTVKYPEFLQLFLAVSRVSRSGKSSSEGGGEPRR